MVSTPFTMLSATKHAHIVSWVCPMINWGRRPGHRLLMVLHVVEPSPWNGQLMHHHSFLGQPWKPWVNRHLHSAQNSGQYTRSYSLFGRRNDQIRLFTNSWTAGNGFAGWSRCVEIAEKDIWGRIMWLTLSIGVKDVKILESQVNAHQKMTLVEEDFSHQVHGWPILWTVSLFHQPSLSLPNGTMNKVAMAAEVEVMHGLDNMDFHSTSLTWLHYLVVPDMTIAETNTKPQIWHPSLGWPARTWWQVDYIGPLPLWKR